MGLPVHVLHPRRASSIAAASAAVAKVGPPKSSMWGRAAFLLMLLLAGSAFPNLRPRALGFVIHPVTLGAGLLFLVGVFSIRRVPTAIAVSLLAFATAFGLACLNGGQGGAGHFLKLLSSVTIILVCAIYVRNAADFQLAVVGICIAVAIISLRGATMLGESGGRGINPLAGIANRNAYSLFSLPALLLGGHLLLQQAVPRASRLLVALSSLITLFIIFSTSNRSGWGGVVVIAAMLGLPALKSRGTALAFMVFAAAASFVVLEFGNSDVVRERLEKTDAHSADRRLSLAMSAVEVGLENPLLGASPQLLLREMAKLGGVRGIDTETHNVTATLFGGTGVVGSLSCLLAAALMFWRPRGRVTPAQASAHYLLRSTLVLWFLRGQFTAEVLYSPSFAAAIGLGVAGCIITGVWNRAARVQPQRAQPARAPSFVAGRPRPVSRVPTSA